MKDVITEKGILKKKERKENHIYKGSITHLSQSVRVTVAEDEIGNRQEIGYYYY